MIKSDQSLWCWGSGLQGKLGTGGGPSSPGSRVPIRVGTDNDWARLATGSGHSHNCALKTDNTLWCWGYNSLGQVGDGSTTDRWVPVQVTEATDWGSIAMGAGFTCAIKTNGTRWCWGYNGGNYGNGTQQDSYVPIQIGDDSDWAALAGGNFHACGIKTNGSLWCWGNNEVGALGDGTRTHRSTPSRVGTDNDWSRISVSANHSCAIKTNGTLWCWGHDVGGNIGNGELFSTYTRPQQEYGKATDWDSVTVGYSHSCARKLDNTVWCWGQNAFGAVGDGTGSPRTLIPTQVGSDNDWTNPEAGIQQNCAIKTNHSLWCWGQNQDGVIGDGTTQDKLAPTLIAQ